ncbi:MAG TPA: alpha/beta fold hydrolase [Azospirillaceae bacterium]|nr:alpha/beta fold hydrolase [Azospirillaceae bacterium]
MFPLFLRYWSDFKKSLLRKALHAEYRRAGLSLERVRLSFGDVAYFETSGLPAQECVMLLHGAGADKNSWCRFVKHLPFRGRVIVPDLPGHGESVQSLDLGYSVGQQAGYMREFLDALAIDTLHLVGHSMGAAVALRLAHAQPDRVRSLILIDAGGVESTLSELRRTFDRTGVHPMMGIQTLDDYKALIRWGMNKPPYIPEMFLSVLAEEKINRRDVDEKIIRDAAQDMDQTDILPHITQKTLILWGSEDRVVHRDDAELLRSRIAQSRKVLLDGIGHVPIVEAPALSARHCAAFLAEHAS